MVNRTLTVAALTLLIAFTSTLSAQTPKDSKSFVFILSEKVGRNQFVWNSTMPVETIDGTAEGVSGWISFDPANPSTISGEVTATVATMQSGNKVRDEHLHSATWLNAEKYPHITFKAKSASNVSRSGTKITGNVTGDFTMHGVTKQMTIPVEITYLKANAETAKRAPGDLIAVTAAFTVALKDFDVKGSEGIIGNKVGETISVTASLFGSNGL